MNWRIVKSVYGYSLTFNGDLVASASTPGALVRLQATYTHAAS